MKEQQGNQQSDVLTGLGLISREALAKATGRSIRMLARDASLRRGPKPVLYGKKVFYVVADVQKHFQDLATRDRKAS